MSESTSGREVDWPTSSEGYELEHQIGHGAFAKVWRAFCPEQQVYVAIKVMDLENVTHAFEDIRQEVNVMRLSDHPNVVRCYCSFVSGNQLWLVMEYMDKGSCLHVMNAAKKQGKPPGMREEWIAYILSETLQGLQYFHSNGQIHRDIKAGNILLSSDGKVQLADFGVAGWLIGYGNRRSTTKTFVGTPCWMAPEVMEQTDGYNQRADVWSVGITALELAKGFAPYARMEPMKVLLMTIEQDPPSLKSYGEDRQPDGEAFSRPFKEFVRLCLQKNPKKRPNCTTLLNHNFFKKHNLPASRASLVHDLLNEVQSVGEMGGSERLPGTRPVTIVAPEAPGTQPSASAAAAAAALEEADELLDQPGTLTSAKTKQPKVAPAEHPAGTTWVFEDGSQVVLKADDSKEKLQAARDEVAEFFKEFEEQGFVSDALG
jgi:serine/threonine-protein kinase OSR1/STK39